MIPVDRPGLPSGYLHLYDVQEHVLVPFRTARSLPPPRLRGLDPRTVARSIGLGRVAIGIGFLADPVTSVRVLGVDTASAKRMSFLARMTAGRDIVLGAGTLAARTPSAQAGWLAAGAVADGIDAVVIGACLRSGTLRGAPAAGIAVGAVGAAGLALLAALHLRRG